MGILFILYFAVFGILLVGMLINISIESIADGTGVGCMVTLVLLILILISIFAH